MTTHQDYNKVLFISWSVPPTQGGSAYITHQLAKNFNPVEIAIIGGSTLGNSGFSNYHGVNYKRLFTEINWRGHGARFFALFRWMWFPFFFLNALRYAKKEKPSCILVCFPDEYFLLTGWLISKNLNLPLYSYFHNTYTDNRTGISLQFGRWLQKNVFRDSVGIFTMSEGMNEYYCLKYPQIQYKLKILPHTFNVNNPLQSVNVQESSKTSSPPFRFVLIGTLNQSNMEASLRLVSFFKKFSNLYHLDIYSSSNEQLLKIKYGLDLNAPGVRHCGLVSQEQVDAVLQQYDACILTHGFTGQYTEVEYRTIFPTRTIPLLRSGKPILAHSPEGSFLNAFILKHDCAELVASKDESELRIAFEKVTIDNDRILELKRNQIAASNLFYGPDIALKLKKTIFSLEKG